MNSAARAASSIACVPPVRGNVATVPEPPAVPELPLVPPPELAEPPPAEDDDCDGAEDGCAGTDDGEGDEELPVVPLCVGSAEAD
jgi:hypothetical protein